MSITRGHLRLLNEPTFVDPTPDPPDPDHVWRVSPFLVEYEYRGVNSEGRIEAGRWITCVLARVIERELNLWRKLDVFYGDIRVASIIDYGDGEGPVWWAER